MDDFISPIKLRPAPSMFENVSGHIKDTEHVRELEKKYNCKLVGCSASWDSRYRARIKYENGWRGVYPLHADDVEVYGDSAK